MTHFSWAYIKDKYTNSQSSQNLSKCSACYQYAYSLIEHGLKVSLHRFIHREMYGRIGGQHQGWFRAIPQRPQSFILGNFP